MSDIRERLKAANKRRIVKYHIKLLDEDVFIRPFNGEQRAQVAESFKNLGESATFGQILRGWSIPVIVAGLVNEDGSAVYPADDTDEIAALDAKAMDEIRDEVLRVSGMTAEGVQDAIKNSAPSPSVDSTSA